MFNKGHKIQLKIQILNVLKVLRYKMKNDKNMYLVNRNILICGTTVYLLHILNDNIKFCKY